VDDVKKLGSNLTLNGGKEPRAFETAVSGDPGPERRGRDRRRENKSYEIAHPARNNIPRGKRDTALSRRVGRRELEQRKKTHRIGRSVPGRVTSRVHHYENLLTKGDNFLSGKKR